MCMIQDSDGYVTLLSNRHPVARKEHKCTECYRKITSGEKYLREAYIWDGDLVTSKVCAHCEVVRQWLSDECGGWLYGALEEDIREHAEDSHYGFGVLRLAAGMGREWTRKDGRLWPIPRLPATSHERAHP